MPPVSPAIGTRLSLAQVISSDPVTVRPNGSAVEMDVFANFAGTLTIGQQVLTGFDESGRLVVFAQTTNPDYIPNTTDAVTSLNIADAAITREHILAGAIDRTRIAQGEVTAALIAIDAINETHISPAAITAPAIAANSIVGYHVVANSISASHISAYSITSEEIAAQSIVASRILVGTITADRIAAGTITATQIAANTITSTQIQTGTIQASDIATGTLTSASGVFGTISADHITTGSLSADRISAGTLSVGTIILNGAVLSSNNYNGNFDGATGWSMSGTNAIFNNVTVRGVLSGVTGTFAGSLSSASGTFAGNISGGTIDIGGADTTSFHVDAAGNMWLGNATYAGAASTFRVSSTGQAECASLRIGTYGRVEVFATNSLRVQATGTGAAAGDLDLLCGASARLNGFQSTEVSSAGHLFLKSVGAGGNNIRFELGTSGSGTLRGQITNAGALVMGSESLLEPITHQFFVSRGSNPVMQIINRTGITNTPHGLDVILGLSGNSANPGSTERFIRFRRGDNTIVGRIEGTGGGVAYQTTSDRALKTDITDDVSVGAAAFDKIPWRSFRWTEDGRPGHGVIAQQLAKIPEWEFSVSKGSTFWEEDPETGKKHRTKELWGVDYIPFIGAMGAKIKQLEARIEMLEAR
jgi:hypothetical protein